MSVPQDKQLAVSTRCLEMCQKSVTTRRELESLTGLMNFVATYVVLGRLHLLPVLMWLNLRTRPCTRDVPVQMDERLRELLGIWTSQGFLHRPVPMHAPRPSLTLMTDASLEGWCGILLPRKAMGLWPSSVSLLSMNWKELMAIRLALVEFRFLLRGRTVRLLSDNTTAVSCLRHQGSVKHAHLHSLSAEILVFCRSWSIVLLPENLKGVLNVLADQGSRLHPIPTEWSLDKGTFTWICSLAPPLQVDLFATRENTQLPHFVSPCPDNLAVGIDAFSLD